MKLRRSERKVEWRNGEWFRGNKQEISNNKKMRTKEDSRT